MENIDFDKIENDYKKSILNESKQKRKKMKRKPENERKVIIISMFVSIIMVFLFLLFIISGGKHSGISMNNKLLDEVVYTNIKFGNDKKQSPSENNKNNSNTNKVGENKTIEQTAVIDNKQVLKKYYVIQILASKDLKAVEKEIDKLKKSGYDAFYIKDGKSKYSYKLLISNKFKTRVEADDFGNKLKNKKIIKDFFTRFRED